MRSNAAGDDIFGGSWILRAIILLLFVLIVIVDFRETFRHGKYNKKSVSEHLEEQYRMSIQFVAQLTVEMYFFGPESIASPR